MKTKHAPGPLHADMNGCEGSSGFPYIAKKNGHMLAMMATKSDKVNAARIVHTWNCHDDLLAAAQAVAALIDKHGIGDDDHESEPVVYALHAAIAKATAPAK